MFGLDDVLGGISGVAGVLNAFGASRRLKEAQAARDQMLSDIGGNLQREYQQTQEGNLQALRRNTGLLGDSLQTQGSDLGSALARAGVSNSTATAGALTQAEAHNAAALQGQATTNFQNEQSLLAGQQDKLNNLKLGVNNWGNPNGSGVLGDVATAQQQANGAWSGVANLAGGLSSLFQHNNDVGKGGVPGVPGVSGVGGPIDLNGYTGGQQGTMEGGQYVPFAATSRATGGALGGTTTNPTGTNGNVLGMQTGGALAGAAPTVPNPVQSMVQTRAAQVGAGITNPGVVSVAKPGTTLMPQRRLF